MLPGTILASWPFPGICQSCVTYLTKVAILTIEIDFLAKERSLCLPSEQHVNGAGVLASGPHGVDCWAIIGSAVTSEQMC
jgi:hypothetical protein